MPFSDVIFCVLFGKRGICGSSVCVLLYVCVLMLDTCVELKLVPARWSTPLRV